jgi:alkanesulfonate monooxygenase SsuD/methylene tetrahydromethanopterin reductase-like flavin-dependent oxidoreductase (luciferase family)
MTAMRFAANLMPELWTQEPDSPRQGSELLSWRRRLLTAVEDAGFDRVMIGDHVMFHTGVGNDGLVDAASVITATERLGVYLSVYVLAERHPVLVARQVMTVAQLAPGRLIIGIGVGGDDRREVEACGVDPTTRGRRTDESLAILRRLLTGDEVTVDGEFFRLDRVHLVPSPEPPIPIVVGGRSAAALRRAGQLGDGWLGIWLSPQRCAEAIADVGAHAEAAGRPAVDWQHGMTFWCGFGKDRAAARGLVAPAMERLYNTPFGAFERYVPHGTPADVAEFVAPYLDAGCSSINFIQIAASPEAALEALGEVRRLLLPSAPAPGASIGAFGYGTPSE